MAEMIYKGDDTGAFGNNFITIRLNNPLNYVVSKAKVIINNGCPDIPIIENPQFPLTVNFTSQQSGMLRDGANTAKLRVWDAENRAKLCKGTLTFYVANGVVTNGCQC